MDLRAELMPPSVSRQRLDELCREILRIADLVLCAAGNADAAVTAFNARTGHDYEALDFAEYEGSRSLDEFAVEAARPARPRIADITTDELVAIVRGLLAGDPESHYFLRLLQDVFDLGGRLGVVTEVFAEVNEGPACQLPSSLNGRFCSGD